MSCWKDIRGNYSTEALHSSTRKTCNFHDNVFMRERARDCVCVCGVCVCVVCVCVCVCGVCGVCVCVCVCGG